MRIRLLKPIGFRKIGSELTVGDGVAELWILQKKAERVADAAPVEAMVPAAPTKGTRGRPSRTSKKPKNEQMALS